MDKRRLIVGVSGASGVQLAQATLRELSTHDDIEVHLVVSSGAKRTWELECEDSYDDFLALADVVHDEKNMAASISSGSFMTEGMLIVPCSMKTLAAVAIGYDDNLIVRAADVCLKEGKKVVLVPREMPLGKTHLKNMLAVADLGAVLVPPMLTFYNDPKTIDDMVRHVVGKALRQFGIEPKVFHAWSGVE
ncbi:MAG: UbiX family flavin prenyltransferase [Atopobiaceae bacterium]|nr:UbiX family flavin prenyltransferase [Atopobiaceae bacterium]